MDFFGCGVGEYVCDFCQVRCVFLFAVRESTGIFFRCKGGGIFFGRVGRCKFFLVGVR